MVYNEVAEDEKQGKEGMNMNPVIVRNVRIGEGCRRSVSRSWEERGQRSGSGGLCGAEPENVRGGIY